MFGYLNLRYPKSVGLLQGLSAGMLLAVVFFGIIPEGTEILELANSTSNISVFVIAMILGALLLPSFEKILPVQHHHEFEDSHHHKPKSVAYIVLGAFGIHSMFELLAILVTGNSDPILGWSLILIIGLHNIPIGFIINAQLKTLGVPFKRVFFMVLGLIIIQCLIAIAIYFMLLPFISDYITGILLGITAGVMLYLTFDELLPQIYKDENQHAVNACVIAGILSMYVLIALGGH